MAGDDLGKRAVGRVVGGPAGGRPLPQPLSDQLNRKLAPYRAYLGRLGFQGASDDLPFYVSGRGGEDFNIYYDPATGGVLVGATFLASERFQADPDALRREVAHHLLFKAIEPEWGLNTDDADVYALESGFADYLAASSVNNPAPYPVTAGVMKDHQRLADPAGFRNLKHDRPLTALSATRDSSDAGTLWGGAFWELRERVGQAVADPLLVEVWRAVPAVRFTNAPLLRAKWVRDKLIAADLSHSGGANAVVIRDVFRRRGVDP